MDELKKCQELLRSILEMRETMKIDMGRIEGDLKSFEGRVRVLIDRNKNLDAMTQSEESRFRSEIFKEPPFKQETPLIDLQVHTPEAPRFTQQLPKQENKKPLFSASLKGGWYHEINKAEGELREAAIRLCEHWGLNKAPSQHLIEQAEDLDRAVLKYKELRDAPRGT